MPLRPRRFAPVRRSRFIWIAPLLMALGGGGAAAIAHPPWGILPGLLGYAALLLLLDRSDAQRPLRSAFLRGWGAGTGYLAVSTFWVAEAFLVDVAAHGWMAPFAVFFLAGGVGLFWGGAGLLYRWLAGPAERLGALRPLVFAAAFGLFEWLRGHVLTGFPWNLPGETFAAGSPVSQAAAVVGSYGLTVVVLAVASAPALLASSGSRAGRAMVGGALALLAAGVWIGGAVRLNAAQAEDDDAPLVRVVQAHVDQRDKWRPENLDAIVNDYARLSARPAARLPDVVIWPESALPAAANQVLAPASPQYARIVSAFRPGQTLLMGAYRLEPGAGGRAEAYNSLLALRREADGFRLTAVYDKHRLVPFGEYLPLAWLLRPIGFDKMARVSEGFRHGPRPAPISTPGLPRMQPLICYESLYPGFVSSVGGRPRWIVNVSNDAWFGRTSGPLQHLNLASYRGIEHGLPIVRATPTGVSAVIDAHGRVLPGARLEIGVEGVIDRRLPPALPPTPYDRFGDLFFAFMVLTGLACALPNLRVARPRGV